MVKRIASAAVLLLAGLACVGLTGTQAQEIVPVKHGMIAEGHSCGNGSCGTCNDCVRITEMKKVSHPVYACKIKEVCIPTCSLFSHLFGGGDCKKIEVRQLVKKIKTEEECRTKCVTAEEAAKHFEAEAKKFEKK